MQYLTVSQIRKAASESKYLLLRFNSGYLMGINSGIMKIIKSKNGNKKTEFIGFIPCGIEEYIQHKHPFKN